jgi:hypothetical protein
MNFLSNKNNNMKRRILFLLCLLSSGLAAQDSTCLKVHFIHGSRPKKAFKNTEKKWMGGKKGGHVGVEACDGRIVNFMPQGTFHWFSHKDQRHSRYTVDDEQGFYNYFSSDTDSLQRTVITIPVSAAQKARFDSITAEYLRATPYDYAFLGMRCAAASYDMLAHAGVVKMRPVRRTYKMIFYPKILRKKLLRKARKHHWTISTQRGSDKRKWEK